MVHQTIYDALVAGWLAGASHAITSTEGAATPEAPIPAMLPPAVPPPTPPVGLEAFYPDDEEPLIRLPAIEHGIKQLQDRQILQSSEFYALAGAAKDRAFTITADITADSIAKVRDTIVEDLQDGTSLKSFREKVATRLETLPISESHLEHIYRNNVNEAFSQGMERVLEHPQVENAFPYRQYVAIHDARARHEHKELEKLGLNGTAIYHQGDPSWRKFRPPWAWQCFLPGTEVQGRFNVGLKSFYSGEAVEIVTRLGNRLRVTVNHPILTENGFVAAGSLKKGDKAISYVAGQKMGLFSNVLSERSVGILDANQSRLSAPDLSKEYAPAVVEQVFSAIEKFGIGGRMPTSSDDLHGDAKRGCGYVDAVATRRELLLDIDAPGSNLGGNFGLAEMNEPLSSVNRRHHLPNGIFARRATATSPPATGKLSLDGCAVALDEGPLHLLGIGTAARINAPRFEFCDDSSSVDIVGGGNRLDGRTAMISGNSIVDTRPEGVDSEPIAPCLDHDAALTKSGGNSLGADAELFDELRNRFPAFVATDEVIDVELFDYSGHVYDLQAENGWLFAGNIVASNCRCGFIALTIRDAARKGVKEAQEWLDNIEMAKKAGTYNGLPSSVEPDHVWVPPPPFNPPPGWERLGDG